MPKKCIILEILSLGDLPWTPPKTFEEAVDAALGNDEISAAAFIQNIGEAIDLDDPSVQVPEDPRQQSLFLTEASTWEQLVQTMLANPEFVLEGRASRLMAEFLNRDSSISVHLHNYGVYATTEWVYKTEPTYEEFKQQLGFLRSAGFNVGGIEYFSRRGLRPSRYEVVIPFVQSGAFTEAINIDDPAPVPSKDPGQQELFPLEVTWDEVFELLSKKYMYYTGPRGRLQIVTFSDDESAGQFRLRLHFAEPYYLRRPRLEPVATQYSPKAAKRMDQAAFANALQYLTDNRVPWHLVRDENYAIIGESKPYYQQITQQREAIDIDDPAPATRLKEPGQVSLFAAKQTFDELVDALRQAGFKVAHETSQRYPVYDPDTGGHVVLLRGVVDDSVLLRVSIPDRENRGVRDRALDVIEKAGFLLGARSPMIAYIDVNEEPPT